MRYTTPAAAWTALSSAAQGQIKIGRIVALRTADSIEIRFDIAIGVRAARPNHKLTITPHLFDRQTSRTLRPVVVETRRSRLVDRLNNTALPQGAIAVRNGTKIRYFDRLPFEPWTNQAQVRIDMVSSNSYLDQHVGSLFLGALSTEPTSTEAASCFAATTHAPFLCIEGSASVEFAEDQSAVAVDFRNNRTELDQIRRSIEEITMEPNVEVVEIELRGTCSPDASVAYNARLARARAEALREYLYRQYGARHPIRVSAEPEDWGSLRQWVELIEVPDREEVLRLIDSTLDPDTKEQQLARTALYPVLYETIYPRLRRVDYTIRYRIRK